jgi:putative nucleotidyltransferase with HDIG domain
VKWTVERLLLETPSISSLPGAYTRLNDAVNDPRTSSRDVANVITEDTALAARLLKIANSAFFGFPSRIDTISRAVTLVGTRQLRDLALATSIIQQFDGLSTGMVTMESFWQHSIACGVVARILATHRREPNVERFFIAGLMHDIGRLLMFSTIPELVMEALDEAECSQELLYRTERKLLGFDHADVGGALLRQWKLPVHTVNAIAYHHRPAADSGLHTDTAIVHIADLIANAMQTGSSGERYVPALDNDAWTRLGISENILGVVLSELERQYKDAVAFILPDATH